MALRGRTRGIKTGECRSAGRTSEPPEFYGHQAKLFNPSPLIGGDTLPAAVALFDAPAGFGEETWLSSMPGTTVVMRLDGAPVTCRWGVRKGQRTGPDRNVSLQLKGTPNHFTAEGAVRFAEIYIPDPLLESVCLATGTSGFLREDFIFVANREIERSAANYIARALTAEDASLLEMEVRAILLVHGLTSADIKPSLPLPDAGGLAPYHVRRVTEYMLSALNRELTLAELAKLVGLSPYHFCRAFKRSVGVSPFRWQLERRIERAQRLILDEDMSLTEVAFELGYADQGSFGSAFRRVTGMRPAEWRRRRLL